MKKFRFIYVLGALGACMLVACGPVQDRPYDVYEFENGGASAPYYNGQSAELMSPQNQYAGIDSYRPRSSAEMAEVEAKWNTTRKSTMWQEYHGTMIRVEVLLGAGDLREMRLRLVQNANGMDIDFNARETLDKVAEYEMEKVCGRNSSSYMIVYDRPSFEVMRPNPYFDFQTVDDGVTMREYGFECVYD